MISEKNRLIICNTQGESLGEMIFDHDLFLQANLLPSGDDILGGWLEDWQVKGILYFHPEIDSHNPICTTGEYVSMHDPVFPSALRQWLEKHNLYSILLPEPSWELWNTIQQLPLLPDEQFRLGMKLASFNGNDHDQFLRTLEKITIAIDQESSKPKKTPKKSVTKSKKVKVTIKK